MSKHKVHYGLVSIITTLIISLVVFALSNLSINKASATDFTLDITDTLIELSLLSSTISLDLEFTNGSNTAFTTADYNVAVGTNNTTGYYLSMSTNTNQLTRTASITDNNNNTTTPTIDPIPLVSGGYTIDSFKNSNDTINKWGYSVDDTNFYPMDDTRNTILNYNRSSINKDTTTITFATKVDTTKPSGTYTTNINFTVVANPTPLYYMQEVSTWCPTLTTDQTIEAIDTRDYKTYYVLKARDNNCWMTENLDLDLSTNQILTSEDTDLNLYGSMGYDNNNGYNCSNSSNNCENGTISWIPERSIIPSDSLNSTTWQNDNNNPYSWQGIEGECPNNPNASCNDRHSYANNYYNWSAAIASNNSSSYTANNTIAANSICPAGWRLPNAASMTGGYEFSKLLYEYGVTNNNTNGTGYASGGFSRIINTPLWFVRSGAVNGGTLYNLSDGGYYWSSAVISSSYAYYLYFNSGYVNPAYNYSYRRIGFSVRCTAR